MWSHRSWSDWLVAAATALMPPSRRDWGRAISAELECCTSNADRARLVLAAVRIGLLTPPGLPTGLREYARAAGRSALLALVAFAPIGLAVYLFSVALPSAQVAVPAVVGYGYPLLVLLAAGARARRSSARAGAPVVAGLAAGLVLAILVVAAIAVVDNVFFSVISHQSDTIEKFRASGMTSMRAYLNRDLESTAPVFVIILAIAGAAFGPIGPVLARALTPARAESPARRHRTPGQK